VSPPVGCYHPHHNRHLLLFLSPKADTHFTVPRRMEGCNLGVATLVVQVERYLLCLCVSVRLSVCPSQVGVLRNRLNVGSGKQRYTIASPGNLVTRCKRSLRNSDGITPNGAPNEDGVVTNSVFRPVEKCPPRTHYRRKFMSIRHGSSRPRRYVGGGIRVVINNIGCPGSLFIKRTAHFSIACM